MINRDVVTSQEPWRVLLKCRYHAHNSHGVAIRYPATWSMLNVRTKKLRICCNARADTTSGTWWHEYCKRGDEVFVYALPRNADIYRLRNICELVLEELIEATRAPGHEEHSSQTPQWSAHNASACQVLRSSSDSVPAWFALSEPHTSRLRGTFVIASHCMSHAPQALERAIFSRLNERDINDAPTSVPQCLETSAFTHPEARSPTTSTLAKFTVRLAPLVSMEENRACIATAWALAISDIYSRPHVSIEYRRYKDSDPSLNSNNNNCCTSLAVSLLEGSQSALDGVLSSFVEGLVLDEQIDRELPAPDEQMTIIRELAQDASPLPGGFELLQRRAYYPYNIALEWVADRSEFQFQCHWDRNILCEVKIRRLIECFRQELESMHKLQQVSSPSSPRSDGEPSIFPLDSPSESALSTPCTELSDVVAATEQCDSDEISAHDRKVMLELNSGNIPVATRTISQLVSDSYMRQPEAMAVASWDRDLSYKELDYLSKALAAHLLKTAGTQPTAILTVFSKSALAVVVLLAVLRSGHYYVPVDPSHPLARKKTVYEQARCRTTLTSPESEQACQGLGSSSIQVMTWELLDKLPCINDGNVDSSSLDGIGVVLFTSGSTGKPKGVVLKHRALSTGLLDHGKYLGLDSSSHMLSFASYAFDAHLWDTWACLIYGGKVCIPNSSERTNDLQGYINRAEVSIGILMPAALQYLEPYAMPSLKKLGVGGEAVTKTHLIPWKNSKTQVFGAYGPSECTVMSSANMHLSSDDPSDIGKPVGGGLWITDPANVDRLLPCGTEGELVITGNHIADGYLDNDAKTRAAFVTPAWPDWVPKPGRAYRTGDLAVLDSCGTLRIRGRMDGQIKISGLRIERGELEHHIASCELHANLPIIEKVEVGPGKHQLVCFFVPRGMCASFCAILPHHEALEKIENVVREHLEREVPAGWMPNAFVFLTQMPLNTSDKIDRQHLLRMFRESAMPRPPTQKVYPEAKGSEQRLSGNISDAATEAKDALRRAWSQVLGIDDSQISDDANFLRLGGSSMDAIKLVASLRKQSVDINTTQVLTHPILSEQASLVSQKKANSMEREHDRCRTPEPFQLLL